MSGSDKDDVTTYADAAVDFLCCYTDQTHWRSAAFSMFWVSWG